MSPEPWTLTGIIGAFAAIASALGSVGAVLQVLWRIHGVLWAFHASHVELLKHDRQHGDTLLAHQEELDDHQQRIAWVETEVAEIKPRVHAMDGL